MEQKVTVNFSGLLTVLAFVLMALKLTGTIAISWWAVWAPIWAPCLFAIGVMAIVGIVYMIVSIARG